MRLSHLNKDEWKQIYNFYRMVVLPYLHKIADDANERNKAERKALRKA